MLNFDVKSNCFKLFQTVFNTITSEVTLIKLQKNSEKSLTLLFQGKSN